MWDSFADTASLVPGGGLDWVTLFYIGTVILRMPEPVFWRSTLRKVQALFACHCQMVKNSLPRMA
jgi:hypothetical protein